jgi:hypothetical protein
MLTGEGLDKMADTYPRLFMGLMHHRTTKGERMTFRDKPWLTAIYKDNSREMVIIKCSQVHMTEHALCAMFTFANKGKRGMYVLPSKEHRKTFVGDRVNRIKDFSPLYANAIKSGDTESDSNVYKSIFGHGWKFVGSNVKKDFFEFPCDVLMFDEYDELDQDNLWYAYDRVANVAYPTIWKFGNPTRDNHGIHAEFMASDQKEWHVTCEHCGHEQIMEWETHFVEHYLNTWKLRDAAGRPICTECDKPFDRLGPGRWIAMNPGTKRKPKPSGYRITRLFTNKHKKPNDIVWLFKRFIKAQNNPTALQNFHNNYLGVTYENVDFKVSKQVLARSVYDGEDFEFDPSVFRTVMGVDQGKKFTCVISIVWNGELIDVHYVNVSRWSEVEKLETDWNVVCTVVDAQGGGYEEVRDFCKAKGHRWMCYYRPKDQVKTDYKLDYKEQIVETNRTENLDTMVKQLIDGKAHVRADWEHADNKEYVKQMREPARVTDSGGRPIWTKGKDHYFHASGYRYLAYKISGMRSSVAAGTSWHTGHKAEEENTQPKTRIIGEIKPKSTTEKPKKRSWSI